MDIEKKEKGIDTPVPSAFFKANTHEHILLFYGGTFIPGIHPDEKIRIKFEVDTAPPDYAGFEHRYRLLPYPYEVFLYDAPSLFAGKVHAVLCRGWKNRIKGRDLYDFVFFLSRRIPVNLDHLQARLLQSGYQHAEEISSLNVLKQHLMKRFETVDYHQAKEDVLPFIRDPDALQVWCADFFKQITDHLSVSG